MQPTMQPQSLTWADPRTPRAPLGWWAAGRWLWTPAPDQARARSAQRRAWLYVRRGHKRLGAAHRSVPSVGHVRPVEWHLSCHCSTGRSLRSEHCRVPSAACVQALAHLQQVQRVVVRQVARRRHPRRHARRHARWRMRAAMQVHHVRHGPMRTCTAHGGHAWGHGRRACERLHADRAAASHVHVHGRVQGGRGGA